MRVMTMDKVYRFTLLCLLLLTGMARAEIETITYLHNDHLGSPVLARDSQGNTLWREDYSPWGERLIRPSGNSADIGYTGHYEETDIGLTYAMARWYDPQVGRFLATDAVDFTGGGTAHFNRYVYANNNPYIYNDPDGRAGNLVLRASWEVGTLGGRYVVAPKINLAINYAVGGVATYTLGTYLYEVAHNEASGDGEAGTAESDYGCVYECDGVSEGQETESGLPYIGTADDKERRAKTARDGRDRSNASTVGEYKKGDSGGRREAEQNAMNDRGGKSKLDNKRNEVRESRWKERGIRPPSGD